MYTNILMPTEGSELAQGYPAQHRLGQADRRQSSASLGRIIKLEFIAGEYSGGQSQPTFLFCNRPNFDLVINLKTAQPLGIEIPSKLLFTADEVIEQGVFSQCEMTRLAPSGQTVRRRIYPLLGS